MKQMIEKVCLACEKKAYYPDDDGTACAYCGEHIIRTGRTGPAERVPKVQHEAMEQEALFQWAAMMCGRYPMLRLLYHIPNGGSRHPAEAARMKRQGVKAGVSDLHLPVPRGMYHGLYIELKYGKNKPSKEQAEWITDVREQGYVAEVCYGWEAAAEVIRRYLELPEVRK